MRLPVEPFAAEIAKRAHESPEFWTFESGAGAKDLSRLQKALEGPVPAPLASFLSKANGGFASLNGKTCLDCPSEKGLAKSLANCFLTSKEIPALKMRLFQNQCFYGDFAEFPFVPVLRSASGSLLCLSADPDDANVYLADPAHEPDAWPAVYENFTALLAFYLQTHGSLEPACTESDPG